MEKYDFLVIGSGIAGLSFALKASEKYTVCIVTKVNEDESNTKYAQGGIAAVSRKTDSFTKHIQDTLIAGDGLCNTEIVKMVVKKAPKAIADIINLGTLFDKDSTGNFDLAREGGHSEHRIMHHKDATGSEIQRALLKKVHAATNINIFTHYFAVDLITEHHLNDEKIDPNKITCFGTYVLDIKTGEVLPLLAKLTVMCSGGVGQIYANTTNPIVATGDGIAMVHRAKGKIRNMEFMQFHPTALYNPGAYPAFLISEALRGAGAIFKNKQGYAFMDDKHKLKSLVPRDIAAREVDAEMKKSGEESVYLDITHLEKLDLLDRFPTIYAHCLSIGIDISKEMIPVIPAAHYLCGGILVDANGYSSIQNLYACGECASTGLHGANRLASNSLIEALVFSEQIFQHAKEKIALVKHIKNVPIWDEFGTQQSGEDILVMHNLRETQKIMFDYVGIVRSDFRLQRASLRLAMLAQETEEFYKKTKLSVRLCELRNLITVAELVVSSAKHRKESRGLHFNTDYPNKLPVLEQTIL